jgi:hypothetical protein
LDRNEVRPSRYGAWDFFQRQTALAGGILTDEVKTMIKQSTGNFVDIPVLNAEDVTITNVRSCVIPADVETSALVRLTFITYAFGFTMTPARHFNNDISYRQLFERKMENYLLKLALTLDQQAVNVLNTNRNVYFPSSVTGYYPQVGNALQVTAAQRDDFFNQLEAILATMDQYGGTNVIGSTSLMPMVNRLKAQGGGNQVNQSFQFDPYRWLFSNRVINAAGIAATGFAVPDGMVATMNRNTPDQVMRSRVGSHKIWGTEQVPIVNLNMGTYYTEDCADMTALDEGGARMSHLSRSKVEGFAFDTDVCFVTAYNSAPASRYYPILKFEVSAT